jgi:hypothetical protein
LKRLSDRARARYECPFCDEDEAEEGDDEEAFYDNGLPRSFMMNASYIAKEKREKRRRAQERAQEQEEINVSASGDIDILITDGNGKRTGYDIAKKNSVNEIPGALVNLIAGNGEEDNAPEYLLPLNPANKKPYKITVGGTDSEETADLQVYGSGFVVGFSDISVDKGESLNMTVSPDGRELSFTASADGETPGLYITTDDGADKPSYEFEIGGIALAAGKTVSVRLDPDKGLIYFRDDDGDSDKYDVSISRTNPNGKVDEFDEFDLSIGKNNSYVLNFGAWDGKGDICAKDDDDADGSFEDEECTEVADEDEPVKKAN